MLRNKYDFVLLFEVINGNPNGDPDAGNMPRIDPETGVGIVSDVCIKRKIRNYVSVVKGEVSPYHIYIRGDSILSETRKIAYEAIDNDVKNKIEIGRMFMCKNFYDVRMFGAVMTMKAQNCGQVKGPVQLANAFSIDPVAPLEMTITRMAVETPKEAENRDKNQTMGHKHYIPYGLYRVHGSVDAAYAHQTGVSEEDVTLFWEALVNMFEHDRSAARGEMATRKLFIFKHASPLGNTQRFKLTDSIIVKRKDPSRPARAFSDYAIEIDDAALAEGVNRIEFL